MRSWGTGKNPCSCFELLTCLSFSVGRIMPRMKRDASQGEKFERKGAEGKDACNEKKKLLE